MKHHLILMMTLTVLSICSCGNKSGNVTGKAAVAAMENPVGAYSHPGRLSESDEAVFLEAVAPYIAPELKPSKVARQVVAGTNYRFDCRARGGGKVSVVVYEPLPGAGDARITSVNGTALASAFPDRCPVFITPAGKPLRVACIYHGSLAFEYDGKIIQVDPVFSMGGTQVDYSAFGKADAIFITHAHRDHLDPGALDSLSGPDTALYLNAGSAAAIGKGTVLANGASGTLSGGVKYEARPAYNITEGRERFHPKGDGNGYVFDFDGFRVYVSGDTEPVPEMDALGGIELAFLAVNQPYTMTVAQCVDAARVIRPAVLIPYHSGDTDLSSLPEALRGQGTEVRIFGSLR